MHRDPDAVTALVASGHTPRVLVSLNPQLTPATCAMAKRTSESSFIDDGVSTLFHSLPIEVVVEILAFASLLSTKTALSICLVATWTNALGREGLYGLVVLSNTLHLYMFIDAVGYKSTIYRMQTPSTCQG